MYVSGFNFASKLFIVVFWPQYADMYIFEMEEYIKKLHVWISVNMLIIYGWPLCYYTVYKYNRV